MAISFTMTMDVHNFAKILILPYLVAMTTLLLALPCGSSYPDTQAPALAPVPEAGTYSDLVSQVRCGIRCQLYRRLADAPVSWPSHFDFSPPAPPSDILDLTMSALPTPGGPSQSPSPTPPPPPPSLPSTSQSVPSPSPSPSPSPIIIPQPPPPPPPSLPSTSQSVPSPSPSPSPIIIPQPPPPPEEEPTAPANSSSNPKSSNKKVVPLAVSLAIGAILCLAGFFYWLVLRRKKMCKNTTNNEIRHSDTPISGGSGSDGSDNDLTSDGFPRKLPKKYPFNILVIATSNFNEENKLGQGGFGPVFKGLLENDKVEVAVKRVSKRAKGGLKHYKAEVKILTRLSHRNLVELLGWCDENGELLLVYKFMPNGNLNSQLYNKSRLLTWRERYNIVLGLASALNYLHEECEECVLHRDIKPDNVLLDSSFNAKLSDFGLARLVDHEIGLKATALAGTMGYLAPEHILESRAGKESDVYSFGVVLLEIACGQSPLGQKDDCNRTVISLIDLVWDHYGRKEVLKMADKRLNGEYNAEQMERVMIVGLWCAYPIYTERPTIVHAIKVLKFDAPLPELPPNKPPLLPTVVDLRFLYPVRSSPENSSGPGFSRSSEYVMQFSHLSTSTTDHSVNMV